MRIRSIKPEFWADTKVASLPIGARLTFIGLWNIADDAGYLVMDVGQIAHDLYGYDPREERESAVEDHLVALEGSGRVQVLPCGHAYIPTFERHQRLRGGTARVETVKALHDLCPAQPRTTPHNCAVERSVALSNVAYAPHNPAQPRTDADNPEGSSSVRPTNPDRLPEPPGLPSIEEGQRTLDAIRAQLFPPKPPVQ
jgi:hypothetical protein